MKSSDLRNFLAGKISSAEFINTVSNEISNYTSLMKKAGSSIPLNLNEDVELMLSKKSIDRLLKEVQFGNLSNIHLAYICDCLTLAERVKYDTDNLQKILFDLADSEINGDYKESDVIANILINLGDE